MTHKTTVATLTALTIAFTAGSALAHGWGGGKERGPRMDFEAFDTNADGKLSRDELEAAAPQGRFGAADADGDGLLTRQEAVAAASDRAGARFDRKLERFDANGDGALTQEEMKAGHREARMERMFERLDENGDGFISKDEAEEMRGRMKGYGKRMRMHD